MKTRAGPTTTTTGPAGELIDELAGLGFHGAPAFIATFGVERIRRAIDRALSLPDIRSVPAYIRYLVRTAGPIPDPYQEQPQEPTPEEKLADLKRRYPGLIRS